MKALPSNEKLGFDSQVNRNFVFLSEIGWLKDVLGPDNELKKKQEEGTWFQIFLEGSVLTSSALSLQVPVLD